MSKEKKLKILFIPIDHWFETEEDKQLFVKMHCPNTNSKTQKPQKEDIASSMWIHEAIKYLGLDRIGIKRPDKAIHRLIKKGALHPQKISGRLVFYRKELDVVIANGDHKRGKGRPKLINSA